MASLAPQVPPDIARIAGPLLVGYLLNWGLFGVLTTQVYVYYLAFPKDPSRAKILVYAVYIFEMVQTILFTYTAFATFATGFGDVEALNRIGIIWFTVPMMSCMVAFAVQAFYAYRIAVLSQSKVVASVVILIAVVGLAGGMATGSFAVQVRLFSDLSSSRTFKICTALWNGGGALCDAFIAACMTFYLSRSKTQWKPTQNVIRRLIRLTIETGTLTATIAIINLILSMLPGSPTYFQTTSSMLGKMYANTMLVVFNSRAKIGRESETTDDNKFSSIVFGADSSTVHHKSSAPPHRQTHRSLVPNRPRKREEGWNVQMESLDGNMERDPSFNSSTTLEFKRSPDNAF